MFQLAYEKSEAKKKYFSNIQSISLNIFASVSVPFMTGKWMHSKRKCLTD